MHELILGGARSGKSRCAEQRAADWLAVPGHSALLLATALAADAEMAARIARHRADRASRLPALPTLEVPRQLAAAVARHSAPERLLVVDCLTLWLTQLLMPPENQPPENQPPEGLPAADADAEQDALLQALLSACGPVILVSNEIGLGVMPMSAAARGAVDALGRLHQRVAAACERVTLMVAGIALPVKGPQ
jgi:adenosylcobinamide kinase / adenosylcobinamide-phosphate guanylyltransferase